MKLSCLTLVNWGNIVKLADYPHFKFMLDPKHVWPEQPELVDYPTRAHDLYEFLDSSPAPPDIILIEHSFEFNQPKLWKRLFNLWGGIPFFVYIEQEKYAIRYRFEPPFNWTLSLLDDGRSNTFYSAFLDKAYLYPMLYPGDMGQAISHRRHCPEEVMRALYLMREHFLQNKKERFCNFVYGRASDAPHPGTQYRERLCRTLMDYKKVDCGGDVMNNTKELREIDEEPFPRYKEWLVETAKILPKDMTLLHQRELAKLRYTSRYKFSIAAENKSSPNYVSEKILHALFAGSIPIYWGTQDVTKIINPRAFVNCNEYDSVDAVVERVKEIDQSPQLYQEYINQAPFLPGSSAYDYGSVKLRQRLAPMHEKMRDHIGKQATHKEKFKSYGFLGRSLFAWSRKPTTMIYIWLSSMIYLLHPLRKVTLLRNLIHGLWR